MLQCKLAIVNFFSDGFIHPKYWIFIYLAVSIG